MIDVLGSDSVSHVQNVYTSENRVKDELII